DAQDNLVRLLHADGTAIDAEYSPTGRIIAKVYSDGLVESFSYDALRRLVSASNSTATIRLKWDEDGNLVQEQQNAYTLDHAYDPRGSRIQSTDSLGRTIHYSYDSRNQLRSITDSLMGLHLFEYDAVGWLRRHTMPNGAMLDYAYDLRGRTNGQRLHGLKGAELEAVYKFDPASRLTEERTFTGNEVVFRYDACDRLLDVHPTGHPHRSYKYDLAGNAVLTPIFGTVLYSSGNRLAQADGITFDYNARDLLSEAAGNIGKTHFVYNAAGRLSEIWRGDEQLAGYAYDPLGRRVTKSVRGSTTVFSWNGFQTAYEETEAGVTAYLSDESRFLPLSRSSAGTVEHFVADRRGCVTASLDASASLTGTFAYDELGTLKALAPQDAPPFRLRGQYFDLESGLHYNLQRYYHPSFGLFLSRDPLGIEAGFNAFQYGPNTITWEDPFGLESECQGDVFYRAMSTEEKQKVLADCQLHAKKSKCPEGPYVTQTKKYCESAMREKPDDYEHLAEICTQPGTVQALQNSPFAGVNGSQTQHWPPGMSVIASGQVNRIEMKWERLGRPDEALNYGLSKGEGLKTFNDKVTGMKFTPSGETCAK
ncbi:MAG: RHS repeat-associated core domain-containing protein, partial [Bryobacteraceae bacterium]